MELCQCQGDAGGRRPQGGVSFRFRQHTRDFEARPTGKPGGPCLPRWVMHRDPLWAQSRKKEWSHPPGSLASDAHDASWSPATSRTEYKVVGSSGPAAVPRTRDLRLGMADPPSCQSGPRPNHPSVIRGWADLKDAARRLRRWPGGPSLTSAYPRIRLRSWSGRRDGSFDRT